MTRTLYLLFILIIIATGATAQRLQSDPYKPGREFQGVKGKVWMAIPSVQSLPAYPVTWSGDSTWGGLAFRTTDSTVWYWSGTLWHQFASSSGSDVGGTVTRVYARPGAEVDSFQVINSGNDTTWYINIAVPGILTKAIITKTGPYEYSSNSFWYKIGTTKYYTEGAEGITIDPPCPDSLCRTDFITIDTSKVYHVRKGICDSFPADPSIDYASEVLITKIFVCPESLGGLTAPPFIHWGSYDNQIHGHVYLNYDSLTHTVNINLYPGYVAPDERLKVGGDVGAYNYDIRNIGLKWQGAGDGFPVYLSRFFNQKSINLAGAQSSTNMNTTNSLNFFAIYDSAAIRPQVFNNGFGSLREQPYIFDINSSRKGAKLPRLNSWQMYASTDGHGGYFDGPDILGPSDWQVASQGLLCYCIDSAAYCYYDGTAWRKMGGGGGGGVTPGIDDVLAVGQDITENRTINFLNNGDKITITNGDLYVPSGAVTAGSVSSTGSMSTKNTMIVGDPGFTDGTIQLWGGGGAWVAFLNASNLTASRAFEWPDASGVVPISVNGEFADNSGNIVIPVGTGTLTSVTASYPLLSSGGTAPVISADTGRFTIKLATGGDLNKVTDSMKIVNDLKYLPIAPSKQNDTTSVTVSAGVNWFIVNPVNAITAQTITMPASPVDGQTIIISFGGTLTAASTTVVNTLTIAPGAGWGIVGSTVFYSVETGNRIVLKANTTNSKWYYL